MDKQQSLLKLAAILGELLKEQQLHCAVAESCTGGGLAAMMTEIPGSSQWFDRGFVTYTNKAKQEMLGVTATVLLSDGAVSEATVCAMAKGAILHSHAQLSVAISGIAGPGGGSKDKPVGTVWIACMLESEVHAQCYLYQGDRHDIRQQAIQSALSTCIHLLTK